LTISLLYDFIPGCATSREKGVGVCFGVQVKCEYYFVCLRVQVKCGCDIRECKGSFFIDLILIS